MTARIKTRKGLLNHYHARSTKVQEYFQHLPKLVEEFPLDVALAYVFARLEGGQNMALYCGLIKRHRAWKDLTWKAIMAYEITRKDFIEKYKIVFGAHPPVDAQNELSKAEAVRDAVMHGKGASETERRNAIADVLLYAEAVNADLERRAGFCPFCPDLRGVKGRTRPLDESTTRWLLKGMGFTIR